MEQALRDAGAERIGASMKCPFHDDKTPSAGVHEKDGAWHFTCHACGWNGGKRTGDSLDVIQRARGVDFKGALTVLGIDASEGPNNDGNGAPRDATGSAGVIPPEKPSESPSGPGIDVENLASEAYRRLQDSPDMLDKLWRTRAVDSDAAKRFRVGIDANRRYWTFPVSDGGRVVAVKHHRIEASTKPKCFWLPKGVESRRLFPVCLDYPGPVWLCPGELKALAVIAAGRSAVGITGGETAELPDEFANLLHGRAMAVAADDDETGRKWGRKTVVALTDAGIDACAVDVGLGKVDGRKDIGDLIRERAIDGAKDADAIAAGLDHAYQQSDPWGSFTLAGVWNDRETWAPVEHIPTGLRTLDESLGGGLRVGGVSLFVGKAGRAKTQTVTQIAVNAATAGVPVGFVSLEMTRRDLAHLIAANLADVPRSWISSGRLSSEPAERLRQTVAEHTDLPLVLADDAYWRGPLSRQGLTRIVEHGRRRFGWRLVVLDYLGLLAPEPDDAGDYRADLENSAALKRLAWVNDVALVVVAALRKYGRKETDAPTSLDDVLGAGRIVYDAVNVFNVDCEQADCMTGVKPSGFVRLYPLKTRYSGLGAMKRELQFRWYPGCGRVTDLGSASGAMAVCGA